MTEYRIITCRTEYPEGLRNSTPSQYQRVTGRRGSLKTCPESDWKYTDTKGVEELRASGSTAHDEVFCEQLIWRHPRLADRFELVPEFPTCFRRIRTNAVLREQCEALKVRRRLRWSQCRRQVTTCLTAYRTPFAFRKGEYFLSEPKMCFTSQVFRKSITSMDSPT